MSQVLLAYEANQARFEPLQLDTNNRLMCNVDPPIEVSLDYQNDSVLCHQQGTWAVNSTIQNFPATQAVSGTVGVNNFPATQAVSGTVSRGITKSQGTLASALSVSGSTNSTAVDVSAMRECVIVFKGDTGAATNTNSSAIKVQCSFDNTNWNDMTDRLYPSQVVGQTNTREGSVHLQLGGIKYVRLNMVDTETVNATLFGSD